MAPSTLDLFILTFNCAKNLINVAVFASHLQAALLQNATTLPDLVVFSLQEVAPLSYAFIGSYFLNPYYARFEEALNLASVKIAEDLPIAGAGSGSLAQTPGSQGVGKAYTLVRAKNVGMTAILLFVKDPAAVQGIEEAECGFGAAGMGNKGAVGLRVTWANTAGVDDSSDSGELGKPTELTFVAAHLAAMEWNLQKRNSNWRTIVSGLTFANPKALLPGVFPANQSAPPPDMSGNGDKHAPAAANSADSSELEEEMDDVEEAMAADTHPLLETQQQQPLHPSHPDLAPEDCATLQDVSIFKPTSHLFVAGDLNYRISSSTPPPLAPFPSFDPESENYYPAFLPRDQLTQERLAGRAFHGMSEAPIRFGPTYKYNVLCDGADVSKATNADAVRRGDQVNGVAEVPWKFAPHRWPGWCDRVLYLDLPSWLSDRASITVLAYDAMPVVRTSDHRAVFLRALVPVVGPEAMRPPPLQVAEADAAAKMDPRVTLPVPVDVHAWERRAAARNREIIVGWSAFLWSTREGAVVLATLAALGVGGWWLWSVW